MTRAALFVPVLLLAACSVTASRHTVYATAPASMDALECVERTARALGYAATSEGLPQNQIRLERDVTGALSETRRTWLQIDAVVDDARTLRLFGERWERGMLGNVRGSKRTPGTTVRSEVLSIAESCGGRAAE
ncbi:MAG TPA: hypothetical protein VF647_23955 [Longimicrobium sp.]|jgi:hypothetical protein